MITAGSWAAIQQPLQLSTVVTTTASAGRRQLLVLSRLPTALPARQARGW